MANKKQKGLGKLWKFFSSADTLTARKAWGRWFVFGIKGYRKKI